MIDSRLHSTSPLTNHPLNRGASVWIPGSPGIQSERLFDLSGYNQNCSKIGAAQFTSWLPGPVPGFAAYDSADIVFSPGGNLGYYGQSGTPFSATIWVRPSNTSNTYSFLVVDSSWLFRQESGDLVLRTFGGTVSQSSVFTAGEWIEVGFAWQPGIEVTLSVNGVTTTTSLADTSTTAGELRIGGRTATTERFDGDIGPVRFYRRLLSPAEFRLLHAESFCGYPDLIRRPKRFSNLLVESSSTPTVPSMALLGVGA